MFEYVCEYLKINDVEYKEFLNLKKLSAVKIGGTARIIAFPNTEKELVSFVCFLTNINCRYKVLGRMTNVLPPDEEYAGVIIKTDRIASTRIDGNFVFADCGASLTQIARNAADNSIGGFEELSGIPGSVGAAVIGNAGAFGREISDVFVSMRCCYPCEGIITEIKPDDIKFGYRWSDKKNGNCLALSCVFKGAHGSKERIKTNIAFFKDKRIKSQPTGYPSLGSTFKRPEKNVSAGALIDSCGLKNYSVGGAVISEKHAGFIINKGNATAKDYLSVADVAEMAVYSKFGIKLEREFEVI